MASGQIRFLGRENNGHGHLVYCNGVIHVTCDETCKNPDYLEEIYFQQKDCDCSEKEEGFMNFEDYDKNYSKLNANERCGWLYSIPRTVLLQLGCVWGQVEDGYISMPAVDRPNYSFSLYKQHNQLFDRLHYLRSGEWITWLDYRKHVAKKNGQKVTIKISRLWRNVSCHWEELLTVWDGALISDCGMVYRKKFAQQVTNQITKKFELTSHEAKKIVRIAGPGAAINAAEYGKKLLDQGHDPDTLLILLNQKGPEETILGIKRARNVLEKARLAIPLSRSSHEFFKILQGARKYIHIYIKKENEIS